MSNFNNLVIHVIRAKDLQLKGNSVDLYVSLSTSGRSKWKSKVSTNAIHCDDGNCEWDEHCEFQMTEADTEMHINVNYKSVFGKSEIIGQLVLVVQDMVRYQPPKWYPLTKKNGKEKGQIQLEYQFANKFASSISNFSLNKIEKERKFEKLKRKMNLIGRSKKAIMDNQSMVSISLSRKSSFSSNASALAFSSPSPNHMAGTNESIMLSGAENYIQPNAFDSKKFIAPDNLLLVDQRNNNRHAYGRTSSTNDFSSDANNESETIPEIEKRSSKEYNDGVGDFYANSNRNSLEAPKNITTKVRHRAEQLLNLRHKKQNSEQIDDLSNETNFFGSRSKTISGNGVSSEANGSRPSSIASSSGFASLGSHNLGALNENTSSEYLLTVIKHLRREILNRDNRIRDLEEYTDKLLSKIIVHSPELLQVSPKNTCKI